MKKFILSISALLIVNFAFTQHENHAPKVDTSKTTAKPKSPKMAAMAMVGNNHVHIDYGSPSVRGRAIWNGLVGLQPSLVCWCPQSNLDRFWPGCDDSGKTYPERQVWFFYHSKQKNLDNYIE